MKTSVVLAFVGSEVSTLGAVAVVITSLPQHGDAVVAVNGDLMNHRLALADNVATGARNGAKAHGSRTAVGDTLRAANA